MAVIGVPRKRLEGGTKVTGGTRFTADLRLPGLTHARLVLSPHPAARIARVELGAARAAPGVLDAVSGGDLPAVSAAGPDQPLARERVYFSGQPVAVVVAETEAAAADAAALVEVEYEELPAVVEPQDAVRPEAPAVLEQPAAAADDAGAHGIAGGGQETDTGGLPNVSSKVRFAEGDTASALAASAIIVGGRYHVPAVHQGFLVFDNGAGPGGLGGLAALLLGGCYRVPSYDITAVDVTTNKTPVTAYRAPGGPQAFFGLESAMDELAKRLDQDPIELRLRNASREGDPRPDGQRWPRIGLVECLDAARRHPLYTSPVTAGEGVGVAVGAWGGGREPAAASCRVEPDGTLLLHLGSVDISGTDTALPMIAAETFGISPDRVRVQTGDTATAPYSGMAGGSKTIYTVGPAVQQAAAEARRQILEIAAEELEAAPEDLVLEDGEVRVAGSPGRSLEAGRLAGLAAQFGGRYPPVLGQGRAAVTAQSPMFTVHLARAMVDAETGHWRLSGYAAIQDVGRALNPPEVEGQIHGGALQSLGRVLGEELAWDAAGQLRAASFIDYGLPTIDQAPEIEVELLELPSPHGPFGAKGVGEPPAVPAPPAVTNAINAACGRRLTRLPADFGRLAEAAHPVLGAAG